MTHEELTAIRARADAATEGPWIGLDGDSDEGYFVATQSQGFLVARCKFGPYEGSSDAVFIAAARTDIPALLAEVTRLCAERDGLLAWQTNAQITLDYDREQMDGLAAMVAGPETRTARVTYEALEEIANLLDDDTGEQMTKRADVAAFLRQEARRILTSTPADALEAVRAEAWDEGHKTSWRRGPDRCTCEAWSAGECACGEYGAGALISLDANPYRATEHSKAI